MRQPEERWVECGDLRLRVRVRGERGGAPALVLLHGFGDALESLEPIADALRAPGRVITADLRGHGESGWPADGDYSLGATVSDLEAIAGAEHLAHFALAGHSTGGMTALAFAARHPTAIVGVALLDVAPFTFKDGLERLLAYRGPETAPSVESFAAQLAEAGDRRPLAEITAWLHHRTRRAPDGLVRWKQDPRLRPRVAAAPSPPRTEAEVVALLQALACPVLLLRGERSGACPPAAAERTLRYCIRHRASCVAIPGAGHALPRDAPLAVALHLDSFVRDCAAGS